MSNLPNELIDDILITLPAKSLMRFKVVSHAWKKKLGSVEFVKYHKDRKKKDSKKVMIYDYTSHSTLHAYSFSLNHGAVESVSQNFGEWKMVGSCDGLLLLVVYDRDLNKLCIWNPYTRECRDLLITDGLDLHYDECGFGFGCASSRDNEKHSNYKVLIIQDISCYDIGRRKSLSNVALYTSRTNLVKRLKNIPYEADEDHFTLVNAKLYIFALKIEQEVARRMILAFDIGEEEFTELQIPDYGDDNYWYSMAELNQNLCMVSYKHGATREQCMWMMKEYGGRGSWSKIFCVDISYNHTSLEPLHLYDNNRILLCVNDGECHHSNLLVINYESENIKMETLKLDKVPRYYKAVAYEETLLSPNAI